MPKEGPRERLSPFLVYLHKLASSSRYINLMLPATFVGAAAYGLLLVLRNEDALRAIGPLVVYTVYPYSLMVFGAFGALLTFRDKWKGLLAVMASAALFDMIGTISIMGMKPDFWLFAVWMVPISFAFIAYEKSFFGFLWSRPLLFYLVLLMLFTYSPIAPSIQGWFLEPLEELAWCSCFYSAFYGYRPTQRPASLGDMLYR